MTESLLYGLFLVSRASWALLGFGLIVGSSLYDWRVVTEKRRANRQKPNNRRPLVSVMVTGELKSAEVSLNSAANSNYPKLEIILALKRNSKTASKLIKKLAAAYPRRKFKYINLGPVESTIRQNRLKRSAKGKFVIAVESGAKLQSNAIDSLISYFAHHPRVGEIAFRHDVGYQPTLRGLVYEFIQPLMAAINKSLSFISRAGSTSWSAKAWRVEAFRTLVSASSREKSREPAIVTHYHHTAGVISKLPSPSVKASILGVQKNYSLLTWLKQWYTFLLLLEPLVIGYAVYVFLQYEVSAALISSWIILGVVLSLLILGDEQLSPAKRVKLTLLLPATICLVIGAVVVKICRVISAGFKQLRGVKVSFRPLVWQRSRQQ